MNRRFEDKFDRWVRDNRPDIPVDEVNQKIHLAILRERMRENTRHGRTQRIRRTAVAVPVLVLMLFASDVSQLGGDSFDLEELDSPQVQGRVFKQGMAGGGINFVEGETEEVMHETVQQMAAGEGEIVEAQGWEMNGNLFWTIKRRYMVYGEEKIYGESSIDPETHPKREFLPFYLDKGEGVAAKVGSGNRPHSEEIEVRIDGCLFRVKIWEFSFPEYGQIKYYLGTPIR